MHYVIGDVHGCFDDLMKLLKIIEEKDTDAQFIFVGDWVDRGPAQYQTLMWMADHITSDGKYQSVRGNHDQEAIEWYFFRYIPWTKANPDYQTLYPPRTYYDFSEKVMEDFHHNRDELDKVFNVLQELPYNKLVKVTSTAGVEISYRIAHAWHTDKDDEDYSQHVNLYERNYWGNGANSKEIYVHGHTPTMSHEYRLRGDIKYDRPGLICYRQNAINVDGGCCFFEYFERYACMLCAICLENLEEIYPYTLEERLYKLAELEMTKPRNNKFNISKEEMTQIIFESLIEPYQELEEDHHRVEMLKRLGLKKFLDQY